MAQKSYGSICMKIIQIFLVTLVVYIGDVDSLVAQGVCENSSIISRVNRCKNAGILDHIIYDCLHNSKHMNIAHYGINKESEEFYAQQNSTARIKKYYIVLKAIIAVVLTAGLSYLFFKYFKKLKMPSFARGHKEMQAVAGERQESQVLVRGRQASQPIDIQEGGCGEQQVWHVDPLEKIQQSTVTSGPHMKYQVGGYLIAGVYNSALSKAVAEQIKYAKSIGLEPEIMELGDEIFETVPVEDIKKISELICEQIEYAQSIGLEPTFNEEQDE